MTEMIERSLVGSDRMKKIIMDLKTFSRLDAAEFAESDIHEALDITLSILTHEYKDRIVVKKEYGELPLIECYIARINQVFMNLLVNAGHAIKDKGEVTIKTGVENDLVKIEISDTGGGIPDNVIDKIFDPFFTTKPVGSGTGLGLSISHGIIEKHKGTISVKSILGAGTTFTVMIPLHQTE
jgi:signal transduction histidine kinase